MILEGCNETLHNCDTKHLMLEFSYSNEVSDSAT